MALNKNKAGIMAAITAAAEGTPTTPERAHRSLPKGTVGSVRAGLGGVQEIENGLILDWGPEDRLELTTVNSQGDNEDIQDLAESIRESGQQVPVLLRPSRENDGFFEVVYGRRRILACRKLKIKVKALIRSLDDSEALIAKGLENASRTELSFYERARFAEEILNQGHSREEAMRALAISKNTLSQLERVSRQIPKIVGDKIGPAPGAGRPKWTQLATAFDTSHISVDIALMTLRELPAETLSDDRLGAVLKEILKRGTRETISEKREPVPGTTVKSAKGSVSFTVKRGGDTKEFADWLDKNIDQLLKESFQTFQKSKLEDG